MSNGKKIGSQWERDIAKYLTKWLTNQDKEYYFWRSPGSGSVGTVSCTNPDLHGDIIPLKEEANVLCSRFTIECKSGYKNTSFDKHLKYNKSDDMKNFWIQVLNDSTKVNKYPMLIYKKKGFPISWIGITEDIFRILLPYMKTKRYVLLYWGLELPQVQFYGLHEFFDIITPKIIKEMI